MEAASLADLPRYPAIGGTCLIALGIFALASPELIEPLSLDLRFTTEPWRLLTSTLLHAGQLQSDRFVEGLAHVGFNCYWLWLLGVGIEQRLGHLRTLGLLVLFAVAGSLLEYAFVGPAVGLSGVVYGLATMLWVLGRKSPSWRGLIDDRTIKFFGFWFVFCVVATAADVLPIANFGHAGGAIFGALIGWAMTARGPKRAGAIAATVGSFAAFALAATVGRPYVNLSAQAGLDAMVLSERAMDEGELEQAIAWAERGVGYWRTPADHWAYLSWLYFSAERFDDARDALAEALEREPDNESYRLLLEQFNALTKHEGP